MTNEPRGGATAPAAAKDDDGVAGDNGDDSDDACEDRLDDESTEHGGTH
jgi:hypothetical protein